MITNSTHNYIVYMHTNKYNNKKYIGITYHKNPNRRWQNGEGYKQQKCFYSAIQKYGWDNFKHEILFENLAEQDAKKIEIQLIAEYNLTDPSYGYNISIGGDGYHKYKTEEDAHKVYLARQKLLHTKRKLDPEKGIRDTLSNARSRAALYADDNKKQQYLNACSLNQKKRYSTDEGREKIKKSSAKSRQKLKAIRNKLIDLYKVKPDLFTEEQYNTAFNKDLKYHYCCNSIKKLSEILKSIQQKDNQFIIK